MGISVNCLIDNISTHQVVYSCCINLVYGIFQSFHLLNYTLVWIIRIYLLILLIGNTSWTRNLSSYDIEFHAYYRVGHNFLYSLAIINRCTTYISGPMYQLCLWYMLLFIDIFSANVIVMLIWFYNDNLCTSICNFFNSRVLDAYYFFLIICVWCIVIQWSHVSWE